MTANDKINCNRYGWNFIKLRGEISEEFFEIFPKIIEKDVIFAAASGRQYYNLLKKFNEVKIK